MGKYKTYEKYKPSGVEWLGEVPEHWKLSRLKFIAEINPSKSEVSYLPDDLEVSFFPMELIGNGGLLLAKNKTIGEVKQGFTYFRDGDVLVAKITPSFENGKGAIAANLENGIGFGTTEIHVIRPTKLINREFIFYLTQSHSFRGFGATQMYGTAGQKRVPDWFLNDFLTSLPPIAEQKSIARFLDRETTRIDTLITKKRQLIALLQKKRDAIIHKAVTKGLGSTLSLKDSGIPWIDKIPEHWISNIKFLYLASEERNSFVNGPFGSDLLTSEITSEGVPVIYSGDIKNNSFLRKSNKYVIEEKADQLDFCRVDPGDLVIAKVGNPPGDTAVYPINSPSGIITQDVVRIKLNPEIIFPEYLSLFLNSRSGRCIVGLISVESTRGRFSLGDLKGARIFIPPLEEQKRIVRSIANTLASLEKQESIIYQTIYCLEKYRQAVITAAVTGKIDVREEAVP
jgi:type I restriction enzyme S subunit